MQTDPRQKMSNTAFLLALISIPLSITGYFSLAVAGVAVMLAVLSLDENGKGSAKTRYAILIAAFTIGVSLILIVNVIFNVLLPAMNDPAALAELDRL